jgi:hypothetical protein
VSKPLLNVPKSCQLKAAGAYGGLVLDELDRELENRRAPSGRLDLTGGGTPLF